VFYPSGILGKAVGLIFYISLLFIPGRSNLISGLRMGRIWRNIRTGGVLRRKLGTVMARNGDVFRQYEKEETTDYILNYVPVSIWEDWVVKFEFLSDVVEG
jgi:hypothetical protein